MQPKRVEMIGLWSSGEEKSLPFYSGCPDPAELFGTWNQQDQKAVIKYLQSGIPCREYLGHSKCLLCEEPTGHLELTDGEWGWPEGLSHYVSTHDVMLPDEFIEKAYVGTQIPPRLKEELGEPQVYLEAGRGPAIPAGADTEPNVELSYVKWLDWAAANTPACPMPNAISIEEAQKLTGDLSHNLWQASVEPVHGRWQIRFEPDGDRVYLQQCTADVLTACLAARRPSDPTAKLDIEQADRISGEYDGDWGAVRILAVAPGAWFVWVKPASADWPTKQEINQHTSGSLELGWSKNHPDGCRSFAVRELDEFCWRQTLKRVRGDFQS